MEQEEVLVVQKAVQKAVQKEVQKEALLSWFMNR